MKQKLLSIVLVISLLLCVTYSWNINATSIIGNTGSLPANFKPGPGGIKYEKPSFCVGLIDEDLRTYKGSQLNVIKLPTGYENPRQVIERQYSNHYPDPKISIIFLPQSMYSDKSYFCNYSYSDGNIQYEYVDQAKLKDKEKGMLRELTTDTRDTLPTWDVDPDGKKGDLPVYSEAIVDGYLSADIEYKEKTYKKGQKDPRALNKTWKLYAQEVSRAECMKVWNYIFQAYVSGGNTIEKNITYLLTRNGKIPLYSERPELAAEVQKSYGDLLITLYALLPESDKSKWGSLINRYFNADNIAKKPVLIDIETMATLSIPNMFGSTMGLMPCIDYVEYCYSPSSSYYARSSVLPETNWNTQDLFEISAQKNWDANNKRTRNSILTYGQDKGKLDGFWWGFSGTVGDRLSLVGGDAHWSKSDVKGIMEVLKFKDNMIGFIVIGSEAQKIPPFLTPEGRFGLDTKPDSVTKIAAEKEKIGDYVTLNINLTQSDTKGLNDFLTAIKDKKLKIKTEVTRTSNPAGIPEMSLTGTNALGKKYLTNNTNEITEADLTSLLKGDTQLVYQDDTTEFPILPDSTVTFNYTANVTITIEGTSPQTVILTGIPDKDKSAFYRPPVPIPEKGYYTSEPSFWSEIKQGTPNNESFEAMAGTPTITPDKKDLYFASGGSEYIVNIETEYVPNASATRTYKSTFTGGVSCVENTLPHSGHGHGCKSEIIGYTSPKAPATPQPIMGCTNPCDGAQHRPCNMHYVGGYTDTWTQTSYFDYMKINKVQVWKLVQSKVNGMTYLIDTDEVTASIKSGEPNEFYNIASANTSSAGRLRYSLDTDRHDYVEYSEGSSDNEHSNSTTGGTVNEQAKFTERRNQTTNVTAVSDFLILQTSSGDQSVMYFEKTSPIGKTTDTLQVPKTSKEAMWDNNPLSAANWSANAINIGSYNGKYYDPSQKYLASGNHVTVPTIFDTLPAGLNRPTRPSSEMLLFEDGLDITDTLPNGFYPSGESTVFYKNIIKIGDESPPYSVEYDYDYCMNGQKFTSTYSDAHVKVNDVVIHDPVSVEYSMVVPLPNNRDQRTTDTSSLTPTVTPVVEYDKILECEYTGTTAHTSTCYDAIVEHSGLNTHVHNGACTLYTTDQYLCGITPVATYSYNWYHPDCGSFMNYGPSPDYCSCCGAYGYSLGSPTIVWNHTHSAACGVIHAGSYSCSNLPLNTHACDANCIDTSVLKCTEPHHSGGHYEACYKLVPRTNLGTNQKIQVPTLGTFTPGNFINLDYEFQVYFPNLGDFYGDGSYGIGYTTEARGKGYVNSMNTEMWTKTKSIQFPYNVIYNDQMYIAGEEIDLPVSQTLFDFYCPLGNSEHIAAKVKFRAQAMNSDGQDNDLPTNRTRYENLNARHSAYKESYIDVVGRIGSLVIEDTGDFRFSNFFKQPVTPLSWNIRNVIRNVDLAKQNKIIGSQVDVRGVSVGVNTDFLDTYGLLPHLRQQPIDFPLSPEKNSISSLKKQPLRPGYDIFADIQTIGNYYNDVQIIQYYYDLNLDTSEISPVDLYINDIDSYKVINKYGLAVPGWSGSGIYKYIVDLNWSDEAARRNYSTLEQAATNNVADNLGDTDINNIYQRLDTPAGEYYPFGTAQVLFLTARNRTFIGSTKTYGNDKNPNNRIDSNLYAKQSQRWHFTSELPSSVVAVKSGQQLTHKNIDTIRNNRHVLIMAADIKAIGDTYSISYKHDNGNQPVVINGKSYPTNSIPYTVIAVYSADKSSMDDLSVRGTH